MSFFPVFGFGLKVGCLFWMLCCSIIFVIYMNWYLTDGIVTDTKLRLLGEAANMCLKWWKKIPLNISKTRQHYYQYIGLKRVRKTWWRKLVFLWVVGWTIVSLWIFPFISSQASEKKKVTLERMCDERARMLEDQFNVSMNHIQAMSMLISTFHDGKYPSAIDQKTFARYIEGTAFERPLTSGVAYAVRVLRSEKEEFEKQQGWTIKRMDTLEQSLVHKNDYAPEALEPFPVQEEYAPVIFAQDTIKHVISFDMLSGKEDRQNVLRARESGKGVLTAPFRLLKTKRLGVILTFAVYKSYLPSNATPNERIQATVGYLGGVFHIESLVEKLLQQLASKQTILVNVYDTTNQSHPIRMYGSNVSDDGLQHISSLSFGDPLRNHEMRCRFKHKPPWPWLAITTNIRILTIALLVGYIFYATVNRIANVENDFHNMTELEKQAKAAEMMELKKQAEAADIAYFQFLATVFHGIRTQVNHVLGKSQMLMDKNLDDTQLDYIQTAQSCGRRVLSLAKGFPESLAIGLLDPKLEAVRFYLRPILDDVLSCFKTEYHEKVEWAVYISDQVPDMLIGDPRRFRNVITNLMWNSIKLTEEGHIFVTVHLVEELIGSIDVETESSPKNTLSGFPVADRRRSWGGYRCFGQNGSASRFSLSPDLIHIIVSVEDTGVGILPLEAQHLVFSPSTDLGHIDRGIKTRIRISQRSVSLMKGEIGFVSIPKIGSTCTFTAVFTNASSSSNELTIQQISSQSNAASSEFNGMTALVVDQRPVRAKMSRYHIQRLGIRVVVVSDLYEGLSSINCGSTTINMVLVEQEVWDKDSGTSALFVRNLRKIVGQVPPNLFILTNSITSCRISSATSGVPTPTVIMKPLMASMLAASLQRAMGAGKANLRNGELPSLSLCDLLLCRRILIIDDDNVNLRVAADALEKHGALVECADNGKRAILLLKPPHHFDACFMHIQMPEMDGFEATRRIRDTECNISNSIQHGELNVEDYEGIQAWHVPILAMTADVIESTHEECTKCGMDGYVSKPFETDQLYREVSRLFLSTRLQVYRGVGNGERTGIGLAVSEGC
ncbi:histidine kinase 3-like [Pyrus communis]|uniref:histidine kinase 3-like n=1 Tax=Pyrus communis TaxID=23211 RepID=UPI0035C03A0D